MYPEMSSSHPLIRILGYPRDLRVLNAKIANLAVETAVRILFEWGGGVRAETLKRMPEVQEKTPHTLSFARVKQVAKVYVGRLIPPGVP